jgi:hypothetical protein
VIKRDELANPNSCINKAAADEPIFVLRAQDILAPEVVRRWARLARSRGTSEIKAAEAFALADQMEIWQVDHTAKVPD